MINIFLRPVSDSNSLLQDWSTLFSWHIWNASYMCSHHDAKVPELEVTSALQEDLCFLLLGMHLALALTFHRG